MDKTISEAGVVTVKQTPAQRKEELMRDGEFYRAGVAHAKAQIKHGARPDVLFHSAVDHATFAVRSRVDSLLHPTGYSVASMAPYALSAVKFIRHRKLGKPALAVSVLLGVAGWYFKRYRDQHAVGTAVDNQTY